MKRSVLLIVAGLVMCLAFAYGAEAQMAGQKGMMKDMGGGMMSGETGGCGCGMLQCGMGGGMMPGCGMMQGRGMTGRGMMGRRHRMMQMCMQNLGLSAKQKEEIEGIRMATMKDVIRKRADMQIARLELRDLLSRDHVDMKAVETKVKHIEGMRADIHIALIKAKEEVKSKLTPEQRQKMRDMMGRCLMKGGAMTGDAGEEMEMQPPMEKQDEARPESEQMEEMQ